MNWQDEHQKCLKIEDSLDNVLVAIGVFGIVAAAICALTWIFLCR